MKIITNNGEEYNIDLFQDEHRDMKETVSVIEQALQEAFDRGHGYGLEDGRQNGYDDGNEAGIEDGYDDGYTDGCEAGKAGSTEDILEDEKEISYDTGYDAGKYDGYDDGYDDGMHGIYDENYGGKGKL